MSSASTSDAVVDGAGHVVVIQESVRAFYTGWNKALVTHLPVVANGMISLSDQPGLSLELLPDLHRRAGATVRISGSGFTRTDSGAG